MSAALDAVKREVEADSFRESAMGRLHLTAFLYNLVDATPKVIGRYDLSGKIDLIKFYENLASLGEEMVGFIRHPGYLGYLERTHDDYNLNEPAGLIEGRMDETVKAFVEKGDTGLESTLDSSMFRLDSRSWKSGSALEEEQERGKTYDPWMSQILSRFRFIYKQPRKSTEDLLALTMIISSLDSYLDKYKTSYGFS